MGICVRIEPTLHRSIGNDIFWFVSLFLFHKFNTCESTILVIIFWDILMFDKIFVSPQVKRIVIISNKHGIYDLPHELPNDLRCQNEDLKTS